MSTTHDGVDCPDTLLLTDELDEPLLLVDFEELEDVLEDELDEDLSSGASSTSNSASMIHASLLSSKDIVTVPEDIDVVGVSLNRPTEFAARFQPCANTVPPGSPATSRT